MPSITANWRRPWSAVSKRWDATPNRWWPMATTPITPRSQAAANCGVDFYGSWQESWKAGERDAQGRSAAFLASAFPYDAEQDCFTCPAGQTLTHQATQNREHGVRIHVYRAPKEACRNCPLAQPVRAAEGASRLGAVDYAQRGTRGDRGLQGQDGHRRSQTDLRATLAHCRVPPRLD